MMPKAGRAIIGVGLVGVMLTLSRVLSVPIEVKDSFGRKVTLKAAPKRIISLSASSTEMLFAVSAGKRVVGVDESSDYPPAARSIEKVGRFMHPSIEKLISLQPDLIVLASPTAPKSVADELQARVGCPVFAILTKRLNDITWGLDATGKLVGKPAEGKKAAQRLKLGIKAVQQKVAKRKPVRVFLEIAPPPTLMAVGGDNFIDDAIRLAGGFNVAGKTKVPFPVIGLETLVSYDPDVYLISDGSDERLKNPLQVVRRRSGFGGLKAVRSGRVYVIESDHLLRPGPRLLEGIKALAKLLHPQAFRSKRVSYDETRPE